MSVENLIRTATDESLIRELEKRGEHGPLPSELQVRLANLIGYIRPLVQVAVPSVPESKEPEKGIDSTQEQSLATPVVRERQVESDEFRELSPIIRESLLLTLQDRFEKHPERHKIVEWSKVKKALDTDPKAVQNILERAKDLEWDRVKKALEANPMAMWSIQKLEENGGEPDIFRSDKYGFEIGDCAKESPAARRNCSFPIAEFKAAAWRAELMCNEQYEYLVTLGKFDEKTQSWLMRLLSVPQCGTNHSLRVYTGPGSALDQREDRGFRCALRVEWPKESNTSFWKKLKESNISFWRKLKESSVSFWRKLFRKD